MKRDLLYRRPLAASLIFCLEEKGPEAFARALVGDSDTPELIWTHSMRLQRLVPQVLFFDAHCCCEL